ncbi:MAG: cupin domain-containing protein [Paracoccaceae bacterium]
MKILPAQARPTIRPNPDWFTGDVLQNPIIAAADPKSDLHALIVTFAPGARTAWHTHPRGQTIHILSGIGRVGRRGEAPETVRAGDTVFFEPGEEHWHGAAPDHAMAHVAMQEAEDGEMVAWLEHVADADYV